VVDFAALERCKGALNRIDPCELAGKGAGLFYIDKEKSNVYPVAVDMPEHMIDFHQIFFVGVAAL
jgi:hypothetical protein